MRLINTTTLKLKEHRESQLPGYVILSHRWGDEEVTFEDLQSGTDVSQHTGYAKLQGFCRLAQSLDYKWAWLDTACINKSSASELGTALNSMYRWYAESKQCIAYLQDVHTGGKLLEDSEWFDRGWTLQELIAPKNMTFYDRDWSIIGTKAALVERLSSKTKIPVSILDHTTKLSSCSIAQRFSWAANRTTERVEDRAYSLLGLFDIHLEMFYGEREKAFLRLQQKLLLSSADETIFAWSLDTTNHPNGYSGMLAPSPSSFRLCSNMATTSQNKAFSESNLGLTIDLPTQPHSSEAYLAF